MDDDSRVVDKGWDLPEYAEQTADDAVTRSISTNPAAEWLVNTMDSVVVPMSTADVVEALRVHKLTDRSLVWRNGMPEWTSIDRVPSLKLAARMPPAVAPSKPSRPSQPAQAAVAPARSAAPPAPSTAPPAPSAAPPAPGTAPRPHSTPPVGLTRRSTLPFGMLGPNPSRPAGAKPSAPPSAPPPHSEEPEVLAVYARPAATISFDLSPSEPARVPPPMPEQPVAARPAPSSPPQTPPPQTLAPTTTDARSAPRSAPPRAYNPDLSVVAASQFRDVQRSSKRRLLVSSLASAAAASALTLWLSGALPWSRSAESKAPPRPAAPAVAQAAAAAAAPAPTPVAVTPAPAPSPAEPSAAPSAAPASAPLAKAMPLLSLYPSQQPPSPKRPVPRPR